MSVTPMVCMALAFWLGRGRRTAGFCADTCSAIHRTRIIRVKAKVWKRFREIISVSLLVILQIKLDIRYRKVWSQFKRLRKHVLSLLHGSKRMWTILFPKRVGVNSPDLTALVFRLLPSTPQISTLVTALLSLSAPARAKEFSPRLMDVGY